MGVVNDILARPVKRSLVKSIERSARRFPYGRGVERKDGNAALRASHTVEWEIHRNQANFSMTKSSIVGRSITDIAVSFDGKGDVDRLGFDQGMLVHGSEHPESIEGAHFDESISDLNLIKIAKVAFMARRTANIVKDRFAH